VHYDTLPWSTVNAAGHGTPWNTGTAHV
jgi:hypothetical protein